MAVLSIKRLTIRIIFYPGKEESKNAHVLFILLNFMQTIINEQLKKPRLFNIKRNTFFILTKMHGFSHTTATKKKHIEH